MYCRASATDWMKSSCLMETGRRVVTAGSRRLAETAADFSPPRARRLRSALSGQRCRESVFRGCLRGTLPSTARSEEHTSELQSLMRISYAVFCLKKKTKIIHYHDNR